MRRLVLMLFLFASLALAQEGFVSLMPKHDVRESGSSRAPRPKPGPSKTT